MEKPMHFTVAFEPSRGPSPPPAPMARPVSMYQGLSILARRRSFVLARTKHTHCSTARQSFSEPESGLLLLPPPPNPPTEAALKTAFKKGLRTALEKLNDAGPGARLDVALPLYETDAPTRAEEFSLVAPLISGMYQLVKAVLNELGIPEVGYDGIDVRILPIRYCAEKSIEISSDTASRTQQRFDVVLDLPSLVRCPRDWTQLFVPEDNQAEQMFKQFRDVATENFQIGLMRVQMLCTNPQTVPGGFLINRPSKALRWDQLMGNHEDAIRRVLAVGDFAKMDVLAKTLLTMGAFLLGDGTTTKDVARSSVMTTSSAASLAFPALQSMLQSRQLVLQACDASISRRERRFRHAKEEPWRQKVFDFLTAIGGVPPVFVRSRTKGSLRVDSFIDGPPGKSIEVVDEVKTTYSGCNGKERAETAVSAVVTTATVRHDKIVDGVLHSRSMKGGIATTVETITKSRRAWWG